MMLKKHGIACLLMHGFKRDDKKRWVQVVTELARAFALCAASDEAAVKTVLAQAELLCNDWVVE